MDQPQGIERMASRVVTLAFRGVEAVPVDVQVQFTGGEKNFLLVGMGDKAVSESRERVRGAFQGMGLALPAKRIIANLAPADLPKEVGLFTEQARSQRRNTNQNNALMALSSR